MCLHTPVLRPTVLLMLLFIFWALQGVPRLNTVMLTGYLGQDPKPKYFDSGKVVLNLSLAVKREYHPLEVGVYDATAVLLLLFDYGGVRVLTAGGTVAWRQPPVKGEASTTPPSYILKSATGQCFFF